MRFFARGSLCDMNSPQEVRFATLYQQSSNTSWKLYLVHYYVVIRSRTCQHCEISKKLTLNPRLSAKNTPLFLFPYMGHLLHIFAKVMPLHTHLFSFTHNAVFSHILDEFTPKIRWKFFDLYILWIKTNVAYIRLAVIARTKYFTLQLQRQTDLLLCTVNCFQQWARPQNMAVGGLAFYFTLYLWYSHFYVRPPQKRSLFALFRPTQNIGK